MLARLGLCVLIVVSPLAVIEVHATDIPALVQKVKPALVEILTFDQQNNLLKTGTGFFVSANGLLLTDYHVISGGATVIAKTPTGATYTLKAIRDASQQSDVAMLEFYAKDVLHLNLGSGTKAVEGQRVLVIGNPEGLEGTVSDGIISAFRENRSMIQITAPISPGSSGSPVIDESGNAIGIATQIYKEGQNLNFAITMEMVIAALAMSHQAEATPTPFVTAATPAPSPVVAATPTPSAAGSSAEGYFNRAFQEVNSGNYRTGLTDYNEAIRLKPGWAEAYHARGIAYFDLKLYQSAINDYTEAIRLQPDNAVVYAIRAIAYDNLKQFDKAITDYTEAIRLQPDNALFYEDRAIAYANLGKSSEALQDRKKAKELTDKH